MEDLHRRYGRITGPSLGMRLQYIRKKLLWTVIVGGANLMKRGIDIVVCVAMIVLLSPLSLIVSWRSK